MPLSLSGCVGQLDKSAGFTTAERNNFRDFLGRGWVDTFRRQHPDLHQFSYWGFRGSNREKNKGASLLPCRTHARRWHSHSPPLRCCCCQGGGWTMWWRPRSLRTKW